MLNMLVVHQHQFGSTPHLVQCNKIPSEDQAAKALDLLFEPEKGDRLDMLVIPSWLTATTIILPGDE